MNVLTKETGITDGEKQLCDLVVQNALLLTVDEADKVIANGAIAVHAGVIVAVGATQGRGRMDRQAQAKHSRKLIFLYPLAPHAQRCLAQPQKGTHHESTANL